MLGQNSRWIIFVACFVVASGANAYMLAPASIIPLLIEAFTIDKPTAGLAISVAVFGTVLTQLPGGFLMDRYDNRRLLDVGVVAFVPIAVVGAFAPTYPLFLASRFFAGIAAGGLFVLGGNIVSQLFAGSRQGFAMTVYFASGPFGFAISQFGGAPITAMAGWQSIFVIFPALSIIGLVVFHLCRSRPIRSDERISLDTFLVALRNRSVLLVAASGFCSYSLYMFLNSWMPTYASEELPMTLGEAGAVAALLPAVGMVARPIGGWVSDYVGYRRRAVTVASLLFATPILFVAAAATSLVLFALLMIWIGFSLQFGQGVYYVYARELAAPGTGATSLALFTSITFSGTLAAPAVGGWLVEQFSWTSTFGVFAVVGMAGVLFVLCSRDSTPSGVT